MSVKYLLGESHGAVSVHSGLTHKQRQYLLVHHHAVLQWAKGLHVWLPTQQEEICERRQ